MAEIPGFYFRFRYRGDATIRIRVHVDYHEYEYSGVVHYSDEYEYQTSTRHITSNYPVNKKHNTTIYLFSNGRSTDTMSSF